MKRHLITVTAATAALGVLAACSSNSTSQAGHPSMSPSGMPMTTVSGSSASLNTSTPAVVAHNQADITFATQMIAHHRQAVQMADMALTQATNADVKTLAQAIKAAQDPEIVQMYGWLAGWQQPIPSSSTSGMGGMDHTGTGMMSDADMTSLGNATGAAFDRMWVSMMIRHHQGAVSMATTEESIGQNPDAKKLAQSIITSQTAQITQLTTLLGTLPSS
ncbi:MAG: lipoprotein [Frankiales bacterium]|nr:lipoprotein [Frankiales bacterium]